MFVVFWKEEDCKVPFILRITECTYGHVVIGESVLVATGHNVPSIVYDDECCVDMMIDKVLCKDRREIDMMFGLGTIRDPNGLGSKKASFRTGVFETQVERKCAVGVLRYKNASGMLSLKRWNSYLIIMSLVSYWKRDENRVTVTSAMRRSGSHRRAISV